jgi:hypothetical protein
MGRSLGFGSTSSDSTPCSDSLSLRLPYKVKLATECKSLTHYTKGMPSLLAELRPLVCMRIQVLFHSPPGVLFAFPSRYWFTIGRLRVFSLGGWSPHVQAGFHVSRPTFRLRGYHPLWPDFPDRSAKLMAKSCRLFRFRSPLLSESRLISVPLPT